LIQFYLNAEQYKLLGINVSDAEAEDMMGGKTLHPFIRSQFTNPETGIFDRAMLTRYVNEYINNEYDIPAENIEQWRSDRARWAYFEDQIIKDRLQSKYNNLISKGLYVTTKEAATQIKNTNNRAQIRFVVKNYAELADSDVQISDSDLKKAYDKYKHRFFQDNNSRGIKYAIFQVFPTQSDTLFAFNLINKLKVEFEETEDDTLFVYQNSDIQEEPSFFRKNDLTPELDSVVFNVNNGFVYGPILEGGSFYVAKKLGERFMPDSVRVRHIMVANKEAGGQRENIKEVADSLLNALKKGADFYELVKEFSDDAQSVADSGKLEWITQANMGNPIVDTAFAYSVGTYKLVETIFGWHVVHILEKTQPVRKVKVGLLTREIVASKQTESDFFAAASTFAIENKTKEAFESAIENPGGKYFVREDNNLTESSKNVLGLDNSRSAVKWAFGAQLGEVSEVLTYGNRYVVAMLSKVRSEGIPPLSEIKDEIKTLAIQDKKAEIFAAEFEKHIATGNIDAVANAVGKNVQNASDITFSAFSVPGAGFELELVGAIFGLPQGKISKPIKGNNGVYVVVLDVLNETTLPNDLTFNKNQQISMMAGRASSEAQDALRKALKVKDYRFKFN
jgi:peptidyl-prolyl cis-trans isomerase D